MTWLNNPPIAISYHFFFFKFALLNDLRLNYCLTSYLRLNNAALKRFKLVSIILELSHNFDVTCIILWHFCISDVYGNDALSLLTRIGIDQCDEFCFDKTREHVMQSGLF